MGKGKKARGEEPFGAQSALAVLDALPTCVMFCDRDLVIRYMNRSSLRMLRSIEDHLALRSDEVVGTSIDSFHRSVGATRGPKLDLLDLPYRGIVTWGSESIDLFVEPITKKSGDIVGAFATWNIVTKRIAAESEELERREAEERQSSALAGRVREILAMVGAAAAGDLTVTCAVDGDDPVGQLADGLRYFFEMLRSTIREIDQYTQVLSSSSEELRAVSQQMNSYADETSTQARSVAEGSQQVSANVELAAAGAEEMNASIRQIAENSNEAAVVARTAVDTATVVNETVVRLGNSSVEIGKFVSIITAISEQTHMLALNATIEAARAGTAGKAFGVVANEVKALATGTAQSAAEVAERVAEIQNDVAGTVDAISRIVEIVAYIDGLQASISTAVEEQAAATGEIGRNVADAARSSTDITMSISDVATAATATSDGAAQTRDAVAELAKMASDLQTLVGRFAY